MAVKENEEGGVGLSVTFSAPKQDALLGHLLTNPQFFLRAVDKLKPGWFADPYSQKVAAAALAYYEEHEEVPSEDEVRSWRDVILLDRAEQARIEQKIGVALLRSKSFRLKVITSELTEWMRCQIFKEGMVVAKSKYNDRNPALAFKAISEAVRKIQEARFEKDDAVVFDLRADCEQHEVERDNALTFGIKVLDRLLLPEATVGSLLPGDTTILLAPVNVGKTRCQVTVAAANLRKGKSVLWIPHEGDPGNLKRLMWSNLLGLTQRGLLEAYRSTDRRVLDRVEEARVILEKRLVMVPMMKPGLFVEDVVAGIRQYQQEREDRLGHGFDLVVDDYPAKLITSHGDKWSRRQVDAHVYNEFVMLALENRFHVLSAIQTNREGSKINKRLNDVDRLLVMEDVLESWEPMATATNVITINRDPVSVAKNLVTYYISKSRSSEVGYAVVCRSSYATSTTHSDELKATWYRGTSSMSEKVDGLLAQYEGKGIPEECLA